MPPPPKLPQKHENPAEAGKCAEKLLGCPLASRGTIELQKHKNPTLGWVAGGKLYRTASQSLTLVSI
jgi:hypothetical protein